MFINKVPEVGEERYWTFVDSYRDRNPSIVKVKFLDQRYDKITESNIIEVKIIENIFSNFSKGIIISLEYSWQLQKTLEDAMKIMILGIFKGENAFFNDCPPWE